MAMISEARANSAHPAAEERRAPNWSAASPPRMIISCRGEQVGVDDPLDRRRTKEKAARHRGQRRHDRRAVFADGQHRQATGDQHQPGIARQLVLPRQPKWIGPPVGDPARQQTSCRNGRGMSALRSLSGIGTCEASVVAVFPWPELYVKSMILRASRDFAAAPRVRPSRVKWRQSNPRGVAVCRRAMPS